MKQFSNRNSSRRRFTLNLRKCKTILRPNLINQNILRFDKNESKTSKRLHFLKIERKINLRICNTLLVRFKIAAKLSSIWRQFFILRRWQLRCVDPPLVRSWKSRGGRSNEVAARGWILIKNRYITPIRGSATADYEASSLIRQRLFEPRLGWWRPQLSASMSRH